MAADNLGPELTDEDVEEIAREVGYFTATQVEPLIAQCEELTKMLGASIRSRNNSLPRAPSPKPRA